MGKSLFLAAALLVSALGRAQLVDPTAEAMKQAFERSLRMGRAEEDFASHHPVQGLAAGRYVQRLREEGFDCRVDLIPQVHAGMGSQLGSFTSTLEPFVRCAREPSGYSECAQFRVVVDVDWRRREVRPVARLTAQLDESAILRASPICESRPPSLADRESIRRALESGDSARIH